MQTLKVKLWDLAFRIGAVSRADGHRQRVHPCPGHKIQSLVGVCVQVQVVIIRIGCLSHMAQFPLNGTAHAMGQGADNGGPLYIFLIGQGGSVKHDISKTSVNAVHDHIKVAAVIQV